MTKAMTGTHREAAHGFPLTRGGEGAMTRDMGAW